MDRIQYDSCHFIFVLTEGFSQSSLSNAMSVLNTCNRILKRQAYTWSLISETGDVVTSACGIPIAVSSGLYPVKRQDFIMLLSSVDNPQHQSKTLVNWVRRESMKRPRIAALDTATYLLAAAGLLNNQKCTLHWESQDAFKECYPDIDLVNQIYTTERSIFTCAGGTATIDMMLNIVETDHDGETARDVADQLVYVSSRSEDDRQRISLTGRFGIRNARLADAITHMENNLEFPLTPAELAASINVSVRQLERIFSRYMDCPPKRYYMTLRLEKARRLIAQTDMSLINISMACGFTSTSHFSRWYKRHYGMQPSKSDSFANRKTLAA